MKTLKKLILVLLLSPIVLFGQTETRQVTWTEVQSAKGYILKENDTETDVGNVFEYDLEISTYGNKELSVIAYDEYGRRAESEAITLIVVEKESLAAPQLLTPTNGEIIEIVENVSSGDVPATVSNVNMGPQDKSYWNPVYIDTPKRFYWNHGEPGTGYFIIIKRNGETVVDKIDLGLLSYYHYQLEYDGAYEWMVIPYNDAGECQENIWWEFTTEPEVKATAPILTIGHETSYGDTCVVPITVTGFEWIMSCDLRIDFDPNVVNILGITKGDGIVSSMYYAPFSQVDGYATSIFVKSSPGGTPEEPFGYDLPDGTVFLNITFTKVSNGTSSLEFTNNIPNDCLWGDARGLEMNDIPLGDYYINGSVTFN